MWFSRAQQSTWQLQAGMMLIKGFLPGKVQKDGTLEPEEFYQSPHWW